ncbi:MAG: InlB B-repeat-containing protein [Kiritimatiellia bacterium]
MKALRSKTVFSGLLGIILFLLTSGVQAATWTTVQGWTGNSTATYTSRTTGKYTVSLEDNLLLQEGTAISVEGNTNTSFINTDALCNGTIATGSGYRNETHTYKLTAGTVATITFADPMSLYGLQFYTYFDSTTLGISDLAISNDGVNFTSLGADSVSVSAISNPTANFAAYGGYILEGETVVADERETPWAENVKALQITFANAGSYMEWVVQGYRTPVSAYSVTFYNFDGSEVVWSSDAVEPDSAVTVPDPPARDGYYFSHWSLEPDGTEEFDLTKFDAVDHNYTVYAVYYPDNLTYAVSFLNRDGSVYKTIDVKPGESVAEEDLPVLTDEEWYKFAGWEDGWQEVTEPRQITPVFIPYHRVTLLDEKGNALTELKVLNGETVVIPDDVAIPPALSSGDVFAGWTPDPSTPITADTTLSPVYVPPNSIVWSHEYWNENQYYDNSTKAFLPEYSEGNLLLTPDAGVELLCYNLADPTTTYPAVYTHATNNLLHTSSSYYVSLPGKLETMLEIVLPHDEVDTQREVKSIVVWTSSNNNTTGYVETELNVVSVEYKLKPDSVWKPISDIEELNGYVAPYKEGATSAYGNRIEVARRDGSALIRAAYAVRLCFGPTSTGEGTRLGEIQVFGGSVRPSFSLLILR